MRAIVLDDSGPSRGSSLVWGEIDDVAPAAGEVLIEVAAAGVNRADLLQASGRYPPPPGASPVLGLEVSGRIAALGAGVTDWFVGQQVCALLSGGGYAQYATAPAAQVMPIPEGVGLLDAAGLPEVAATVWSNLVMAAGAEPGEVVLVHGGAGGVGSHAIQVARALGCTVVATAGSPERAAFCEELGATLAVCHGDADFVRAVRDLTGGAGADVILDVMGASYLDRNLAALAPDGRLVIIGMQGGTRAELDIATLIGRRLTVIGTALRGRPVEGGNGKAAIAASVAASVWPMITAGAVRPVTGAVFAIEEAGEAHRALAAGEIRGKALLRVANSAQ